MRAAVDTRRSALDKWLREQAEAFLRKVGITKGQTVLDFGCGQGTYTIPAARIVDNDGIVYALDQDSDKIDDLRAKSKSAGLDNIQLVPTAVRANIPLPDESVGVILLYDVLHSWYHPRSQQRKRILHELYRVLHSDGLLSFYPGDPEVFDHHSELAAILREIRETNFCLQSREVQTLVHEGSVVQGHIFGFTKRRKDNNA